MWKMHPVFHASLLSTYQETPKHGPNFLSPPPSLIQGEEEYTIETIITHWGSAACQQFCVRWEGYPLSEDTWELFPISPMPNSLSEPIKLTTPMSLPPQAALDIEHHAAQPYRR